MKRCLGRQQAPFRAGPFELAETLHAEGLALPRHAHGSACVHLVLAGVYQEQTIRGSESFPAQTLIYKPPGEPHSNRFTLGGSRTLRVAFEPVSNAREPRVGPTHSHDPVLLSIANRLCDEIRRPDEFARLSVEGLCLELLARLGRVEHGSRAFARTGVVLAATRLLEERYAEHLCFGDIARELGVNRSHLSRSFHAKHRCTMGQYLRSLRVERVRRALRDTNRSVATIALEAGFADQSHCTRVFRGIVGLAPGAYRRSLR